MLLAPSGDEGDKTQQFLFLLVKIKFLDASISTNNPSLFLLLFLAPQIARKCPPLCFQDKPEKRWLGRRKVNSSLSWSSFCKNKQPSIKWVILIVGGMIESLFLWVWNKQTPKHSSWSKRRRCPKQGREVPSLPWDSRLLPPGQVSWD